MYIKKILEYDYNYATYIVSDGKFDVRTLCMSVPLKSGPPQVGMTIEIIEVFVFEELEIKLIDDKASSEFIINSDKNNFAYTIRGIVFDSNHALIKVGELVISISPYFEEGLSEYYTNGQLIEFNVDRLDSYISQ